MCKGCPTDEAGRDLSSSCHSSLMLPPAWLSQLLSPYTEPAVVPCPLLQLSTTWQTGQSSASYPRPRLSGGAHTGNLGYRVRQVGDGLLGCCAHSLGGHLGERSGGRGNRLTGWATLAAAGASHAMTCFTRPASWTALQQRRCACQRTGRSTDAVSRLPICLLTTKPSDTAGGMSLRRCPAGASSARSSSAKAAFFPESSASLLPAGGADWR